MPIRPIVVYPHPVLLEPTIPVASFDDDLRRLVADMVETMHADHGVGLAANQVADRRRLFVLDLSGGEDPDAVRVFVNPEIVEEHGRQSGEEGCLSFPGLFEVIERPERIVFRALDLDGNPIEQTAEGFFARAVCHEIDHLDGRVFLERMSPLKRRLVRRRIEKLRRSGEWPEQVLAG
ncbi:MAG: peptide deformylase [Acidobacteria bacterium]|nr:MAG: peptide deformylase [Acidobacteriota bacterium]